MDDSEIVGLFFSRSEEAIKELLSKYGGVMTKVSLNALGDKRDAEECVNDACLGVWNAIPPKRPKKLRSFVLRIVRNISINRWYSRNAQRRGGNYEICIDEIAELIPSAGSVEDEVNEALLTKYLNEFLDGENDLNRLLFVRRFWYMDSYEDLAEAVGMKPGAVRTRLTRVKAKLMEHLKGKGVEV